MQDDPITKQRERVKDAHVEYLFACHFTKECKREDEAYGELPVPDGGFRYRQAIANENRKLAEYRFQLRKLCDLMERTRPTTGCA